MRAMALGTVNAASMPLPDVRRHLIVEPGEKADLHHRDTDWLPDLFEGIPPDGHRMLAAERLKALVAELTQAQELLWVSDTWSLLVIFQGLDAAGKDSTIKHVMSGVNPQGCQVFAF